MLTVCSMYAFVGETRLAACSDGKAPRDERIGKRPPRSCRGRVGRSLLRRSLLSSAVLSAAWLARMPVAVAEIDRTARELAVAGILRDHSSGDATGAGM